MNKDAHHLELQTQRIDPKPCGQAELSVDRARTADTPGTEQVIGTFSHAGQRQVQTRSLEPGHLRRLS